MDVGADIAAQLGAGEERVMGVMVESHLNAGRQDLVPGQPLAYGVSITDPCLAWDDTAALLEMLAQGVRARRLAHRE
jgi:3-deoxy-7-phosphoheptulonate synthase